MIKKTNTQKWLIFIDTNVLLDFYRIGTESANRQLEALERHKDSIILNDQVYMEFMKNRQKVIVSDLKIVKKPERINVPAIVSETKAYDILKSSIAKALEKYRELEKKIENILINPSTSDPVYQSINRIYDIECIYHVKRGNKERFDIRNKARKRFCLGYPPRKNTDNSIGDAVNWETIIHCANKSELNHHVLIVSRDGDYGTTINNKTVLNDWLRREFKDRVSKKRNIELTKSLTLALKRLDETVSPEDEKAEKRLLESDKIKLISIKKYLSENDDVLSVNDDLDIK